MTSPLVLDPKNSALLVMDFQTAVVEMVPADKDGLLSRTADLIDAARKAGMRIIYVVVGFRAGYPEVSPRNQSFGRSARAGALPRGQQEPRSMRPLRPDRTMSS